MSERTRLHYPTVYVVHTEDKNRYKSVPNYTVYVGGDEGRRGARPRRERSDQGGGHGHARDREHHTPGTLVPRVPGRRSGDARAEAQGQAQRLEIQTEARTDARAGARRTGAATGRCACAWSTSSGNECRPRACPGLCAAWD